MRSLLRIAAAVAVLFVIGSLTAPGAAYAESGDEHVARLRLRVVESVNRETRGEIERVRACAGENASGADTSGRVARLEATLREGCRLAADLRSVRGVVRHRAVAAAASPRGSHGEARGASWTPGGADAPAEAPADLSADGADVSSGVSSSREGGGESGESDESVFHAARSALPHTPVGVLCVLCGGGLALIGAGLAAGAVRRPGAGAVRGRLKRRG
ncbi:hypothetical protein [Streptomyces sp. NBC_00083]|uniref:hypothetical protein n=1 Tax=Streptomyces sp. NBC_00083 TaxID=2975647 RepID=UPI0022505F88|nr:hypothetical protein [Streptomyces sp. NBC_00083]MCX5388015.1 hypothetical protein [Streptomyces sp. NBC_00083]